MRILPQFLRRSLLICKTAEPLLLLLLIYFPIAVASMYVCILFYFVSLKLFNIFFSIYTVSTVFILVAMHILVCVYHNLMYLKCLVVFSSFFSISKSSALNA